MIKKIKNKITKHRLYKYERWITLLVWLAAIFYLSSNPLTFTLSSSIWPFILRKLAHMFEFGVLAYLLFRILSQTEKRHVYWNLFWAFIFTALYAVSDEYHQTFTAGRVGIYKDVLIDCFGALISTWLMYVHFHHAKKYLSNKKSAPAK